MGPEPLNSDPRPASPGATTILLALGGVNPNPRGKPEA
jgi:hypothetical protein